MAERRSGEHVQPMHGETQHSPYVKGNMSLETIGGLLPPHMRHPKPQEDTAAGSQQPVATFAGFKYRTCAYKPSEGDRTAVRRMELSVEVPMELEDPEEHTKGEKRWAEKLFHHDDDVQQTVAKKNKFNVWCSTGEEGLHDEGLTGSDEWSVRSARAAAYMEACQDSAEWGEEESLLDELSEEIMIHIFLSGLEQSDLKSVSLVCRRWWALSRDKLLWQSMDTGRVFVVGCGQYGQLGLGIRSDQLEKPACIRTNLEKRKAMQVCAARRHSIVLDSEGRVYSFGSGEDGKLGHGDELDQLLPKQIMALREHQVVGASCGVHHTLLLSKEGRLYSFGFAACGQLGHGDQSNKTVPTEIAALRNERITACAAGAHHSLAVTAEGHAYSFGLGHTGQLGHGDEHVPLITYQLTPKRIIAIQNVRVVSAAAGFFNSLLISDDGRLFSFGSGGNGKLGHGDQANQHEPKLVKALLDRKVIQVSAGPCHTLALTDDGKVFSFGNGQNGRLGYNHELYSLIPQLVAHLQHEHIVSVSAGECHSLALSKDGRVFFFGSMGNAINNTNNGVVPWLQTCKHHRIVGIAAGGVHNLFHT